MSPFLKHLVPAFLVLFALLAVGCSSDDGTNLATGDDAGQPAGDGDPAQPPPDGPLPDGPVPVEPDGGIGDGAEPLPGAVDNTADDGTWHGPEVAETNCPGTEFKRVQASAFSFSVPVDFVESDVQPFDSEIGIWTGGNEMEVSFDYGWYSGDWSNRPDAEVEAVDYSGLVGKQIIVREAPGKLVGVFFPEVVLDGGEWNRLNLDVRFTDINDEIIGRCIVGSLSWG